MQRLKFHFQLPLAACRPAWPNITTDANPTPPPPGEFSSSGASNNFLQLNVDVDQALADIFLGGVNPFDPPEIDLGIVWADVDLLDLDVFAGLNFLQNFIMQEQPFAATLNFENGTNQAFTFGSDILLPGASAIDVGGDKDGLVEFTLSLDAQASLNLFLRSTPYRFGSLQNAQLQRLVLWSVLCPPQHLLLSYRSIAVSSLVRTFL